MFSVCRKAFFSVPFENVLSPTEPSANALLSVWTLKKNVLKSDLSKSTTWASAKKSWIPKHKTVTDVNLRTCVSFCQHCYDCMSKNNNIMSAMSTAVSTYPTPKRLNRLIATDCQNSAPKTTSALQQTSDRRTGHSLSGLGNKTTWLCWGKHCGSTYSND